MRYRKTKNYKEKILKFKGEIYIDSEFETKGKWNDIFENNNPVMIEVGCGKGGFLIELAKRNPHINYIGVEKVEPLVLEALETIKDNNLGNIIFTSFDANKIEEKFNEGEVSRLYLNFSDPWPKKRHSKRRLTSINFLEKYKMLLNRDKELFFKTDNKELFEFTIMELSKFKSLVKSLDIDLHSKGITDGEEKYILTEYEKRFISLGLPIYRLEANL